MNAEVLCLALAVQGNTARDTIEAGAREVLRGADRYPYPIWSLALSFVVLVCGPIYLLRSYWSRPVRPALVEEVK